MIAAEQEGEILKVHEIFCDRQPDWNFLVARLPFFGVRRIEWGFNPDRLGCAYRWEKSGENLFVRGDWELPEHFCVPEFSRT